MALQPATTIDEVILRMTEIEASMDGEDGVACFNRLYFSVTQEIRSQPASLTTPRRAQRY